MTIYVNLFSLLSSLLSLHLVLQVVRLSRLNSEAVEETRRAQRGEDAARRSESQALDDAASEQQRMSSLRADLVLQAENVGALRATKDTLASDLQVRAEHAQVVQCSRTHPATHPPPTHTPYCVNITCRK